ncbi:hypothetical protein LTR36_007831 [Oleoguttula mirabilis]|uniref:Small ribosomal subunit protein mS29 n=1 Tax=Oleoguttula mirabilis TaxID=1507867 RepID=A0AAV9J9B2_9PEZI|nr:hypothetical protein LTR36_007831 [Oleoguttula mirabilis]
MSSSICLRCLKRSLVPIEASLPPTAAQRAAFSTSPSLSANPPKKKGAVGKPVVRAGKTLKLAKNKRASTVRPPAPGERKALRKRVVLSNTNALEVPGLQDLTTDNVDGGAVKGMRGTVVGLGNDTVDALRALEAFKPTQGWSLFRRPASLVRRETAELAELLQAVKESDGQGQQQVERRVVFGEKLSGKSVLLLQGMAMAYLQGWLVVHYPDAKDITIAHTSYRPVQTADGDTIYIQPHYTAQLLGNIAKANHGLLSGMRLGKQHQLPVPVQANISLARFAELGANDAELAWPVWQALWSELTAPSQPETEGLQRPPIFVGLDGVDYIMRDSAYLDGEARPVHAHDLALIRDFTNFLSGKTELPNGGMVLAATSASNRPSAPTLEHCLSRGHAEPQLPSLLAARDRLREQCTTAQSTADLDLSDIDQLLITLPTPLADQLRVFRRKLLASQGRGIFSSETIQQVCDAFQPELPRWDPYLAIDQRVADVMGRVTARKVQGLSKEEARGVMEYYARSGMLRGAVTEGLVGEKWTLAGEGIIGELEKGAVRARF